MLHNLLGEMANESTQQAILQELRDKSVLTKPITASAIGNTLIVAPSVPVNSIRLWWYGITADPDNSAKVVAGIRFGAAGDFIHRQSYSRYGQSFAHNWKAGEAFVDGAPGESLFVNLDAAQLVYVNIDYEEITP